MRKLRSILTALLSVTCIGAGVISGTGCNVDTPSNENNESSFSKYWETAWEYMFTATNITVNCELRVEQQGFNGTYKGIELLADGKLYFEQEFEGSGEYADEEDRLSQHYVGLKDGKPYEWYKGDGMSEYQAREASWLLSYGENFATGYMLFKEYSEISIGERYDYKNWETMVVYQDGLYIVSEIKWEVEYTHKFAIKDNKLYSIESECHSEWSSRYQKYVISYGTAEIGDLPEV